VPEKLKDFFIAAKKTVLGWATTLRKAFLAALVLITGGSIGIGVPAFSAFKWLAPPYFPQDQLGGIAVAVVTLLVYITSTFSKSSKNLSKLLKRSLLFIFSSLVLLFIYLGALHWLTVLETQTGKKRFQIGFGRQEWSLVPGSLITWPEYKHTDLREIMERANAFKDQGPETLWKPWTINVAGGLLVFMYFGVLVPWALGFGCLSQHQLAKIK
jgi:hypothetical protein